MEYMCKQSVFQNQHRPS